MNKINLEAWIPVLNHRELEEQEASLYKASFTHLTENIKNFIERYDSRIEVKEVSAKIPPRDISVKLDTTSKLCLGYDFIYVACDFNHKNDLSDSAKEIIDICAKRDVLVLDIIAVKDAELSLYSALLLSELVTPGVISTKPGIISSEKFSQPVREKHCVNFNVDQETGWPSNIQVTWDQTITWLSDCTSFNKNGNTETPIDRTLAAFTHIIGLLPDNEGEIIFRAMQGLESFYCKGREKKAAQLKDNIVRQLTKIRAQNTVPPFENLKEMIKDLYDKRSSFVHGSENFKFYPQKALQEEMSTKVLFATRLLISTLQTCILLKQKSPDFPDPANL